MNKVFLIVLILSTSFCFCQSKENNRYKKPFSKQASVKENQTIIVDISKSKNNSNSDLAIPAYDEMPATRT